MKAIDRLYEYFSVKGLKPTVLEKEICLSNGYFSAQKKRGADMGEGVLNKIIDYCRDLSDSWLLTGRGSMLREDQPVAPAPVIADSGEYSVYYKMYKEEKEENKALIEQIGQLKERLRVQEEKIEGLKKADVPLQKESIGSTPIRKRGVAGSESVQFAGRE